MSNISPGAAFIDREKAASLVKKWSPVLDYKSNKVAPIEDDHTRLSTAVLLENQERFCLNEAGNTASSGGVFGTHQGTAGAFSGDNYASGDARLPKVLIPMIRRTFPELITNEIVGVQPMAGPVGLAFAMRYRYNSQSLGDISGNSGNQAYGDGMTVPDRGEAAAQKNAAGTAAPGNKYYQSGQNKEVGWNWLDTRFTGSTAATYLTGGTGVTVTSAGDFPILAEDTGVAELLANYEMTSRIPQMTIEFEKTAVEAGTRRLATKWSIELEQDLKNMNGIDIDNEMVNAMSYELQAEIDREMVMRMVHVCLKQGTPWGVSFWDATSADARWIGERGRDFYAKVIVEANRVAIRNRRGAANFIIATPRVCAILEMLPEFKFMPVNSSVNTQPVGVAKVGNLGGRFTVYRDTRTDAQWMIGRRASPLEYALLGYKGPDYYDTGIVFCPYIPVMVQRTIGPNDYSPRVGLMTRYGVVDHIFGSDLYYHLIIVKNLGTAFTPGSAHVYL